MSTLDHLAVTPEEDAAFAAAEARQLLADTEDREMKAAIESFQSAIDALLNRGWCRNFLGPFDGCEAMVLLHYHRKPVKATFCGDWDGGWFAELVDGELLPVRPLLFLPLRMPR